MAAADGHVHFFAGEQCGGIEQIAQHIIFGAALHAVAGNTFHRNVANAQGKAVGQNGNVTNVVAFPLTWGQVIAACSP